MVRHWEYEEFMRLLRLRNGMTITKLAEAIDVKRGPLNLVLLGHRSGKPTWKKLECALTKKEWDIIRPFAQRRFAALMAQGKDQVSEFVAQKISAQSSGFGDDSGPRNEGLACQGGDGPASLSGRPTALGTGSV